MILRDLKIELLPGNPPRLKVGDFNINTTEVTAADMFALAEWSLAVGRRLLNAEMEATAAAKKDSN